MDLLTNLNLALGLNEAFGRCLLNEDGVEEVVFSRSEWMTSDPEILFRMAFSNNLNAFWRNFKKIAIEIGDEGLLETMKERLSDLRQAEDEAQKQEVTEKYKPLRTRARREARDYAVERMATQPSRIWPRNLGRDRLGWSKEELEAHYRKIKERQEVTQKDKKYFGDTLWGIFQNGERVEGGFQTKQRAKSELLGNVGKYADSSEYQVLEYDNPKSLTALKKIKYPTSKEIHGEDAWTPMEVIQALTPYIRRNINKFKSNLAQPEDLFQQGALGILDALRTDKGEAPFGTHAYKAIAGSIGNWARSQGVIQGKKSGTSPLARAAGAHGGAMGFRSRGPLIGYNAVWIDKNGTPDYEYFKVEELPTGVAARRTSDPGYQKAMAFLKQKKVEGATATGIDDVRQKTMASMSAPIGGPGETPTTLGATLKATTAIPPAHIARIRDEIENMRDRGGVTDRQWEITQKAFGLDVPEYGMGGGWKVKTPGQYGPGETGEEGEMVGTYVDDPKNPSKLKWDQHAGSKRPAGAQSGHKAIKLTGKGKDLGLEKNPTQIAKETGLSTKRVRDHLATTLLKLRRSVPKDLEQVVDRIIKNIQRGEQPTKEDINRAENLMVIERFTRHTILKLLVRGELDGTCLTEAA